jgi:glycosyltransferase involved in cell wall biosynthesis
MTAPMNYPMVTVLVPTYNRAAFINDAIHTILAQTFTDFEIVVIDDGSNDETTDVLATFNDSRLRVLRQSHRGISAAMNAGLADARGRYISRLDSDDLWQPELLATLVPVLEAQPDVGVVYAQADALDHGVPVHHLQGLPLRYPDDSLRSLVYDDCTCNIALLARRECFERAGPYDEGLIANEDWDMWLRVARHYRFVFIERVLARIRWHSGNLTGPTSSRLTDVLASRSVPLDKLFASPDLPVEIEAMRSIAYENVSLFRLLRWQQAGDRRAAL